MAVNGQFPGPLVEANWGNRIQVTVINSIHGRALEDSTRIHWHEFLQKIDSVSIMTVLPVVP